MKLLNNEVLEAIWAYDMTCGAPVEEIYVYLRDLNLLPSQSLYQFSYELTKYYDRCVNEALLEVIEAGVL